MKFFRITLLVTVVGIVGLVSQVAWAATASGTADLNGYSIDAATDRASAIPVTGTTATISWNIVNTGTDTFTLDRVDASYSSWLPDKSFDINKTLAPGESDVDGRTVTLPSWVLSLKGYYYITVTAYDTADSVVLQKSFWALLGEGSPLTGAVGGTGAALGGVALATGAGAVAAGARTPSKPIKPTGEADRPRGRGLRGFSSIAMAFAVILLLMVFGVFDLFSGGFYLAGAGIAAGIADNVLIRILTQAFRARIR